MNLLPQIPFLSKIPEELALAYRGRPQAPRALQTTPGTMEATIVWNLPADSRGIGKFRIFQGNENNLVGETQDQTVRQFKVKLPANSTDMIYVSAISRLGKESVKVPVLVTSTSDKYVVTGTTGETSGSAANPPADWSLDRSGGAGGGRRVMYR